MLGPLTLAALVATRTIAVVDLSSPKAPALADAMRKTPGLKPLAMSTTKTNAAVGDAESLGILCTVDDGQCLEKLQVILHADEMVAFATAGSSVDVIRLGRGSPRRAHVRVSGTLSATAAAAWDALQHETAEVAAIKPKDATPAPTTTSPTTTPPAKDAPTTTTPATTTPATTTPATTGPPKDDVAGPAAVPPKRESKVEPTPTATSGGVTPALAVTIVGAIVGVACGTGAVVTSADLANKLEAARSGQKPLDQQAYDNGSILFWALTACTVAGVGGATAGGVLTAVE
jgi:hypothetical protein